MLVLGVVSLLVLPDNGYHLLNVLVSGCSCWVLKPATI